MSVLRIVGVALAVTCMLALIVWMRRASNKQSRAAMQLARDEAERRKAMSPQQLHDQFADSLESPPIELRSTTRPTMNGDLLYGSKHDATWHNSPPTK